jgi:putative nucleotidyltransferase with HDIG domain
MSGENLTKAELLQEMGALRQRLTRLEESQSWLSHIEEELLTAEKEKALLFDAMVEPIVYLDSDLQILWTNQAAVDSLKLTPGQSIARCFRKYGGGLKPVDLPINEALRTGSPQEREVVSIDSRVWHLRLYPVQALQGGIGGLLVTLLDISARKRAEEDLQKSLYKLQRAFEGVVQAMAMTMEMKDIYTSGHQRRVAELACALAGELGLPAERIDGLRVAALLHDLGKIAVASEILSKPGKLNEYEFAIIKAHPRIGYDILKAIDFPWPVAQIILQHHERLDGSGYPLRLRGEEILLEAKILGVADVVEAMSSHRPYRPAIGMAHALKEISQNKGLSYEPTVVEACLKLFRTKGFALG